jgi:hypothetical protein
MHALTFQRRPVARKKSTRGGFPWKYAVLTALTAACLTWIVAAERTPKVKDQPVAFPATASLVVVPVPESPEVLELKRLQARNRRLEALVSVLRARSESRK